MGRKQIRRNRGAGPACPALLGRLASALTEAELRALASLDYMTDVEPHLAALRRIVRGDLSVLSPLRWHPREVLELARWDDGGPWDDSRHRKRLFATTALLVAAAEPSNRGRTISINESAVVAVESVLEAFPDLSDPLVEVLDALAERWRGREEQPHLRLAKLLLREAAGAPPEELSALVAAADQLATSAREDPDPPWRPVKHAYGWVFDLTVFHQRARVWRRLLDAALARLRASPETAGVAAALEALRGRKE